VLIFNFAHSKGRTQFPIIHNIYLVWDSNTNRYEMIINIIVGEDKTTVYNFNFIKYERMNIFIPTKRCLII